MQQAIKLTQSQLTEQSGQKTFMHDFLLSGSLLNDLVPVVTPSQSMVTFTEVNQLPGSPPVLIVPTLSITDCDSYMFPFLASQYIFFSHLNSSQLENVNTTDCYMLQVVDRSKNCLNDMFMLFSPSKTSMGSAILAIPMLPALACPIW